MQTLVFNLGVVTGIGELGVSDSGGHILGWYGAIFGVYCTNQQELNQSKSHDIINRGMLHMYTVYLGFAIHLA